MGQPLNSSSTHKGNIMASRKRKSKRNKPPRPRTGNRRRIAQFEPLEERQVLTTLLPGVPVTFDAILSEQTVEFFDITLNSALDLDDGDSLILDTIGSSLDDGFGGTTEDTEIGIYGDNGNLLGENDDIDVSSGNVLSRLDLPSDLTTASTLLSGDYTIAAGAYDTTFSSGLNGSGNPNATSASNYFGNLQVNVVLQQNNFGSITPEMTVSDTDPLVAEEVKWFRFELDNDVTAVNGSALVIDTAGSMLTDAGFGEDDTELGLFDAAGNLIGTNDDADFDGGILTSQLSFGAGGTDGDLSAGTYFIASGSFDTVFNSAFDVTSTSVATGDIRVGITLFTGPIVVTTAADTVDPGDGETSLREAIDIANNTFGQDTIEFDTAGVFSTPQTITLTGGQLNITDDVTINGPVSDVTISGNSMSRVFYIDDEAYDNFLNVELNSLTISNGMTNGQGGGVHSSENLTIDSVSVSSNTASGGSGGGIFSISGSLSVVDSALMNNSADNGGAIFSVDGLTVQNSSLTGNTAASGDGGAIYALSSAYIHDSYLADNSADNGGAVYGNSANVTVESSSISGNTASNKGGGVRTYYGTLDVSDSTFAYNVATKAGGGISVESDALATIRNSTISGNSAVGQPGVVTAFGGGISARYHSGGMEIEFSTIVNNSAADDAGGISSSNGVTLNNSILANNTAMYYGDVFDELAANFSLIGNSDNGTGGVSGTGNLLDVDPQLEPLADNGGMMLTHSPMPGSLVFEAGDPTAQPGVGDTPLFDQRGFDRLVLDRVDIGAIEAENPIRAVDDVVTGTVGVPLAVDITDNDIGDWSTIGIDTSPPAGLFVGGDGMGNTLFGTPLTAGNFTFTYRITLSDGSVDRADVTVIIEPENSLPCDFNGDTVCDGADIDALQANIVTGPANPATFDLTNDGMVTIADRDEWLALAGAENLASGNPYLLGDANLDGSVNGGDFINWNANKFSSTSAWTDGDFNADGAVDGGDFVIWNANKFQSSDSLVSGTAFDLDSRTDDKDEPASRHEQMFDAVFAQMV
jgi:CSLREA domain-containing protein